MTAFLYENMNPNFLDCDCLFYIPKLIHNFAIMPAFLYKNKDPNFLDNDVLLYEHRNPNFLDNDSLFTKET